MDDFKRTHIPPFGNWDYENGLPITQYFESARQAGLVRYSYGEEDLYSYAGYEEKNPTTIAVVPRLNMKTRGRDDEKGYRPRPHVKEQKRQGKVYDVAQTSTTTVAGPGTRGRVPKAVDEDLYKIPPEFLYATYPKKKKRFGFFTRCLVPYCAA